MGDPLAPAACGITIREPLRLTENPLQAARLRSDLLAYQDDWYMVVEPGQEAALVQAASASLALAGFGDRAIQSADLVTGRHTVIAI